MSEANNIVVIDNGTGYTKMGYAGNKQPAFDIPTLITQQQIKSPTKKGTLTSNKKICDNLDFMIGDEIKNSYQNSKAINPIQNGIVKNWDLMEKFWHRSMFDYLRCDPEQTTVVLTEPPFNPPQNRQNLAQIMFQTFNVKGLYIGVQAVFALISAMGVQGNVTYTGTVLDSGDAATQIIPIVDGYVINSCIKQIPLAGNNITNFIAGMIRDRNQKCHEDEILNVSKIIKQKMGYVVQNGNLIEQLKKFDMRLNNQKLKKKYDKYIQTTYRDIKYIISVGPQRFLGPQMFFSPQIIDQKYKQSVDQLIDLVIQFCPIHQRKKLYSNIALSGGSTLFKGFKQRLYFGVNRRVNQRLKRSQPVENGQSIVMEVKVLENKFQRYAVWQGASLLANTESFEKVCHTREQYWDCGPSICRYNAVFSGY